MDREKVINGLRSHARWEQGYGCKECDYSKSGGGCSELLAMDALTLLKEQEAEIEQLNRFVNGFSRSAVVPVRCKDCKHRGNSEKCVLSAISEEKDFPLFMLDNRGDWFCADGERRTVDG